MYPGKVLNEKLNKMLLLQDCLGTQTLSNLWSTLHRRGYNNYYSTELSLRAIMFYYWASVEVSLCDWIMPLLFIQRLQCRQSSLASEILALCLFSLPSTVSSPRTGNQSPVIASRVVCSSRVLYFRNSPRYNL